MTATVEGPMNRHQPITQDVTQDVTQDGPAATTARLIIEPGMTAKNYWRDLWHFRELVYFLAWRDTVVRYKQTAIGVAWALIRPALTMLVFVGFRRLVGLPSGGVPDPILVFAAVLPWQFFSGALSEASSSLIGNANLISKIYFPRLLIPFAAVATTLIDFAITLLLLFALMLWYRFLPGWQIAALPLFVLLAFGLALGFGLLFAALNVEYRDFRYIVPFIVQFGVFVSPIAFSTADVPEKWRTLYALNPLVGIIDGFRWSLLGGHAPLDAGAVAISAAVTGATIVVGIWYFRRMEHGFADVI
jgi:lipopolysaccharide transport system permease protein